MMDDNDDVKAGRDQNFRPKRILGLNPRWKGLNDCRPAHFGK